MSDKLTKLTADEMVSLDKFFRKSKREVIWIVVGVAIVMFLFSILPTGFARFFSDSTSRTYDDPSKSFIQLWGFGAWLIVFILIIALCAFLLVLSKKIIPLKKDLKEGEKLELDVVVASKIADTKTGNYSIRINSNTFRNKRIMVDGGQINQFVVGQKLTISVYKNSMLLVLKNVQINA